MLCFKWRKMVCRDPRELPESEETGISTAVILVQICLRRFGNFFSLSYYKATQFSDVIQMLFISCCHNHSSVIRIRMTIWHRGSWRFPCRHFPCITNPSSRAEKFLWDSTRVLEVSLDRGTRKSIFIFKNSSAPLLTLDNK